MKTKISHLCRSTVSVILAVMMLLSTMLIGTVSTVNAATIPLEEGTVVYVQVKGGGADWYADTNNAFSAWVWGGQATNQWVQLKSVPSTDNKYFYFVVPEGGITSCILHRKSNTMEDGWTKNTNFWNATGDITLSNTNNLITIKGWDNSFSNDSCYQIDSTAKLDADSARVKEGTAVTFTPSLTSNTDFNDIKSVSYTVKKDSVDASSSDYSINGSKITFNKAGNYEVTANVIYNAKGFSDITKTATATTTVTVESSLTPVAESVTLTASPETVTSGGSTKLTATLKNKATGVDKVTYTFKKADGTVVDTVENTDIESASVDVANITSDTTYTVTVSAAEHSDVTATATVTVKQLENWYLMGSVYGGWNDLTNKTYNLTRDPATGFYYRDTTGADTGEVYFRFHDGKYQYCPVDDQKAITLGGEKLNITKSDKAFAFKYSNTVSNYRIWLDSSNANDIKVWITDITKKYSISNTSGKELTISPNQASAGDEVTVTATSIPQGQILDTVTVVGANNTQITTNVIGNTATFVMPNQDVTVKEVTFRDANKYTVNFSSINDEFGTVSAKYKEANFTSGTEVTEGDEVTFTAEPKSGYALSGWTVNGKSETLTDSSLSLKITADTTVVANFEEVTVTPSGYYLLCGTDATFKADSYTSVHLYTNEEGVYYADFDVAKDFIPKSKDYFIIFSTTKDTSGIIDTNNAENIIINIKNNGKGFSLNDHNGDVNVVETGTKNVRFAKVYISKDEVSGFTINITNLDLRSKKITYSAKPKFKEAPRNAVNIIAKNGTQTAKFQSMGTTVITPVENVVFDIGSYNNYTQKATAIKGNKVKVTTTVADAYKDTYYVKGFVVNGESYGIQSGPNDTGVYTLEYQIPDDVDDGTNFEITPVYFLKDSSNCVTFYVEGFDGAVQESWGNTIACYPYYEGLSNATDKNAFGAYPGQPLLYEGGKYYTQIPKSITLDGADKKIVGMTLNNFALESVHGAISTIKENKQSYDYDDFVRIANNDYGNNIIYTFKYSTVKDNFGTETTSPATITKDDFDSTNEGNGWEDLTDYNHRKVDLFGNVLTGEDSNKVPLLVVSNGYFENYQGYYATEWTVYELKDGSYSKIAQIPSSALLLKSKDDLTTSTSDKKYENPLSSYADAYGKLEAYKNTPAQITFESSIKRGYSLQGHTNGGQGGESAERVDGRWYYSKLGEEITAKIAVEYGDTATSDFKNDLFVGDTNETTTIGAHAYFTNDVVYGKTTYKSNIDSSNYFTFKADTIATDNDGQNYVFLGWYLLSDNKYTKLTDAKAPMTGSDTFVARYVKAPAGTVTIDHKLFSAASNPTPTPTPGTGSGKCYVTVRVLDKTTGEVIKEFAETEKSVTLDKTYIDSSKNYKLQITLRTVTSGQDKFNKFYYLAPDKQTYESIDTGTTTTEGNETTVTRTVDIRESFFNHNDDGTYSFKNQTGSDSIHYYSDITETKIPYKITFKYEPRLASDAKQYVVTGYFTSDYILNHGAVLTNDFVMSVAPYEDNFFNTIKWDNANITINNNTETKTAVVNSTTSLRTVTVKALDVNGDQMKAYELNAGEPVFTSTVVYGKLLTYDNLCGLTDTQKTEIAGGKEYIYVAEPEYNGNKFSYWQISTSPDMTDTSAYVTKCFSKEFNYIAYNDYYIWPVYGEPQSITGASTTLNFLDYSRNQSTGLEGENKTDRVFADFALAFDSNGIQLKTYNGDNIKVGMFLEVCGDLESDSTGNVITDINYYKDKPGYSTSETDLAKIKAAILADSANKSLTYTTVDGITRKLLNKPIDIKSLDNKNRIEYYVGYNNNPNNQKKLMRAYSYVIVDNEITLCSTCYSFVNYYNVGNKTYTVS